MRRRRRSRLEKDAPRLSSPTSIVSQARRNRELTNSEIGRPFVPVAAGIVAEPEPLSALEWVAAELLRPFEMKRSCPGPDSPPLITHCSCVANSPRCTGASCGSMLRRCTMAGIVSSSAYRVRAPPGRRTGASRHSDNPLPQSSGSISGALPMRFVRRIQSSFGVCRMTRHSRLIGLVVEHIGHRRVCVTAPLAAED
jgi:hypothetical protein